MAFFLRSLPSIKVKHFASKSTNTIPKNTTFKRLSFTRSEQTFALNRKFETPKSNTLGFSVIEHDLELLKQNFLARLLDESVEPFFRQMDNTIGKFKEQSLFFRARILLMITRALESHFKKTPFVEINQNQHSRYIELAAIVEMINAASSILNNNAVNITTPSKEKLLSILSGDYLLAQASVSLAKLRNHDVTEIISTAISQIAEGQFFQHIFPPTSRGIPVGSSFSTPTFPFGLSTAIHFHLNRLNFQFSSLMEAGCKSAVLICTDHTEDTNHENVNNLIQVTQQIGGSLCVAKKLMDDVRLFEKETGVASGAMPIPVLLAKDEFPELNHLIQNGFHTESDIKRVHDLVIQSKTAALPRELATLYVNKAVYNISQLEPSPARDSLHELANSVLTGTS